ncbi:hypothetical protein RCO27_15105 [Sphingosinicella sp. LHD-64]|uniref:hypothetical protein n=1 Tax=Sphingosinicella sp. LHD-64 TaxID=3072139 RepID=UPI00280CB71B|nr:hypothetical protein [Sphingosinicella sp. LHD-64]MDQ8757556.1 hypothetical protein [Sphingosinicella sp. LHD-64]
MRPGPPGSLPGRAQTPRSFLCAAAAVILACTIASVASAQAGASADGHADRLKSRVRAEPDPAHDGMIGGNDPPGPCVMVDIAGYRAGHLECASRSLEYAARVAQSQARAAIETPVIGAGSPDIRTGVASQAATRQRLGTNYGVAVRPQRPAPPAWSSPMGPRR